MKERPILFSGLMVQAYLAGRKGETRRVMKTRGCSVKNVPVNHDWSLDEVKNHVGPCQYGLPGDRLWVRETFFDFSKFKTAPLFQAPEYSLLKGSIVYRADDTFIGCHRWKPSIFMRRSESRLSLDLISVRPERLHEITPQGAVNEGIVQLPNGMWKNYLLNPKPRRTSKNLTPEHFEVLEYLDPVSSYRSLWEFINGPGSWDRNDWVWVLTFPKI